MTFAKPEFLYGLLLLPLMFIFWLWATRRRQTALQRLGHPALIERLSASVNWRARHWRAILWFLGLALLVIALARPQWGTEVQIVERQGIQVMVALDVSESMLAEDIKPNRLSRAKLEIVDLMNRLGGDEVGLVLFAGASFIQFPLTSDYATARTFLDSAGPHVISKPGTAIGEAIRTALRGFDAGRSVQKVIILITDGEDHGSDVLMAAEEAAEANVIIYAIGFGSAQGEPIPEYNEQGEVVGFKKDEQGEVVLSKLDAVSLQRITQISHGKYYRASADGAELDALLREIGQLQMAELSTQFETRGIERFQGFLAGALATMMGAELIRHQPRRENREKRVEN